MKAELARAMSLAVLSRPLAVRTVGRGSTMDVVALCRWLMLPVVPVVIVVLAFNFPGDGLRNAADPYR